MIVAQDVSLHFQFPVGKKYVLVKLHFQHGEDSEDVLRAFFVQEDIPVYLEIPILALADQMLKDPELHKDETEKCMRISLFEHRLT